MKLLEQRSAFARGSRARVPLPQISQQQGSHPHSNESNHRVPQLAHDAADLTFLAFDQCQTEFSSLRCAIETRSADLRRRSGTVLQFDTGIDRYIVLNLHVIADFHATGDENVLAEGATATH